MLQEVVGNCFGYVESFNTTKSNQLIIRKERLLSWKPPPSGKSKLNFDGPLLKQSKNVGIGVILRDNKGEVLLALSQKEVGMFDVDVIEVLAARSMGITYDFPFRYLWFDIRRRFLDYY